MFQIDENVIELYLERITAFKQSNLSKNEANTRKMVIDPLIELLGWSFYDGEIDLEYSINQGRVDYAFIIEGKPILFLEAKPLGAELRESESNQCIGYGKLRDVKWVALTNGNELKLFNSGKGINEEQCFVYKIDINKLPNGLEELSLLHRDSILSGEIENVVERICETKNAINSLKRSKNQLKEKFKESILSITGDVLKDRIEFAVLQLSNNAIDLIENQTESPVIQKDGSIREIYRNDLSAYPEGEVIVASSRIEGMEFLKKYHAWGFLQLGNQRKPKYFALYVGSPESKVMYFAEIKKITKPIESIDDINQIETDDLDKPFPKGKRVLFFKEGTLVKFRDPISLHNRRAGLRGHRYTGLTTLIKAQKIEDL
jgi:predicted type IV restriction endonuclease